MQRGKLDVVIVGGGPAGCAAAIRARQLGLSVALFERDSHPRFHIGESFLPRQTVLLRELGLLESVTALPHVPKYGASFAMGGDESTTDFWFSRGPNGEDAEAISIERAPFDKLLFEAARSAGAEVLEQTAVRRIVTLAQDDVVLETTAGEVRARVLIDASGQGTLVGKHFNRRTSLPDLCRVAYFQHFENVERREGRIGGHPIIVMCEEGWFWMIPLDHARTSIGLVMRHDVAKATGVSPDRMLEWGIARCPFVKARMMGATGPERNQVCADFSYTCRPYAGPGYFMVGDAATFIDPIFSTGACMGMMSGVKAADAVAGGFADPAAWQRLQTEYGNYVESSSSVFFGLVRKYYTHEFREMFLNGKGPLGIHRAILALLAGHVFPRPVFALRWRLKLFETLLKVQPKLALVPRRSRFSLCEQQVDSGTMREVQCSAMAGVP